MLVEYLNCAYISVRVIKQFASFTDSLSGGSADWECRCDAEGEASLFGELKRGFGEGGGLVSTIVC